ncbi:MAG TPA: class II fructose-bisphosphate aldolase [bacterium]|nr:class II fructose-bisphosphate aldolase [bacterium]
MFSNVDELKSFLSGKAEIDGDGIKIIDETAFRAAARELAENSVLNENQEVRDAVRWVIVEGGQELGIIISSIHDLYMAAGREEYDGLSVPAINIRGMTFDVSLAIFNSCEKMNNKAVIFEIAKSEMGYTKQPPAEYTPSVMAAAIASGYKGPLFIQGDHFQFKLKGFKENREKEIEGIRNLIKEAIEGGYYNIDIDSSTLVDLSKSTLDEQQKDNYEMAAEMTNFIREIQPEGINISVGGEIGEVGEKNSTPEELEAYMLGYQKVLGDNLAGLSKVSVQTGTSHGGVPLPDGSIADVAVDFDTLAKLSEDAKKKWNMGGAVQHGASTLPDEMFHKFVETKTVEIHLATGFQNIILDSENFPADLKDKMYKWMDENLASERKEGMTAEQFYYKGRKKAWGAFKPEAWGLPEETRAKLRAELEEKFEFLFDQLGAKDTAALIGEKIKLVRTKWTRPASI